MCGLIGAVGDITKEIEDVVRDMLIVDVLRGDHSTGLVSVPWHEEARYYKAPLLPTEFLQTAGAKRVLQPRAGALLGHNRLATVGAINRENAHPFEHGPIIGMHNGTLRNWVKVLRDAKDFKVDSDCLLYNLTLQPLKQITPELDGAFALVWYDARSNCVNIARNRERPLFYAYTKDKAAMLYASEPWMIRSCAARRRVDIEGDILEFSDYNLYQFEVPRKTKEKLGKPKVSKLDPFVAPVYHIGFHGGNENGRPASGTPPVRPGDNRMPTADRAMHDLMGRQVQFFLEDIMTVGAQRPDEGKNPYSVALGMLVEPELKDKDVIVRVYGYKSALEKFTDGSPDLLGTVSGYIPKDYCNNRSSPYLTINPSTIREVVIIPAEDYEIKEEDDSPIDDPIDAIGPDGTVLERQVFDELTKDGCSYCSCNLVYGVDDVMWENRDTPLCEECWFELNERFDANVNVH